MRNTKIVWFLLFYCLGCSERDHGNGNENESAGNGENNRIAEFCDQGYCVENISEFDKGFYLSPADVNLRAEDSDGNIASTNTLLVKFRSNASISEIKKVFDEINGKVSAFIPELNIFELRFDCDSIDQIERNIQALMASGIVEYAEKNYAVELEDLDMENPDSSIIDKKDGLWGFEQIKLAEAYRYIEEQGIKLHPIKIAVLDGGFNLGHREFTSLNVEQYDLADKDSNVSTITDGHGTAVAGIIFADNEDGGVNGIAFGADLLAYKILSDGGNSNYHYERTLIASIRHAVSRGASVVNFSGRIESSLNPLIMGLLKYAVRDAYNNGVIIVTSAGNGDGEVKCIRGWTKACEIGDDASNHYPSAFSEVISVGVVNRDGNRSEWSNYSKDNNENILTLAAPGEKVLVLRGDGGYDLDDGTSFAAPMVAGLAGLLKSIKPELTANEVRQIMVGSADEISVTYPDGSWHTWRRINAEKAVVYLSFIMFLADLPRKFCNDDGDCNGVSCENNLCVINCTYKEYLCTGGTICLDRLTQFTFNGVQYFRKCYVECNTDNDCPSNLKCLNSVSGNRGICLREETYCGKYFDSYGELVCESGFYCSGNLTTRQGRCNKPCNVNNLYCGENRNCISQTWIDFEGNFYCGLCEEMTAISANGERCNGFGNCPLNHNCISALDGNAYCRPICNSSDDCTGNFYCSELTNTCGGLTAKACVPY